MQSFSEFIARTVNTLGKRLSRLLSHGQYAKYMVAIPVCDISIFSFIVAHHRVSNPYKGRGFRFDSAPTLSLGPTQLSVQQIADLYNCVFNIQTNVPTFPSPIRFKIVRAPQNTKLQSNFSLKYMNINILPSETYVPLEKIYDIHTPFNYKHINGISEQ